MVDFLYHLIFPRQSNNHRPKVLHPSGLTVILLIFLSFHFLFTTVNRLNPRILGYAVDISLESLLYYTNEKRMEQGLKPLNLNENLSLAALEKAEDMFSHGYWAHNAPDGTTPWKFIYEADYNYLYAGENLARDFNDSSSVVSAWMKSKTHRDNILNANYQDIGFAVVNGKLNGKETTLVVQMFGAEQSSLVPGIAKISAEGASLSGYALAASSNQFIKEKKLDIFRIDKNFALIFSGFLIAVLSIDLIFVYRKKLVRLNSHNFAHIGYLLVLILIAYLTSKGSIL